MIFPPFSSAAKLAAALLLVFLSLIPTASAAKKEQKDPLMEDLKPTEPFPPAYMTNLPKDYLDRIYQSRLVSFHGGDEFQLADTLKKPPGDTTSIGWIRWGQAGLMLGLRADEINAFIASPAFAWSKHHIYAFGFFAMEMFRFYGLFKADSPYMPGRLTRAAQENMEKGFWAVAKEYGKLADAQKSPWLHHGSANHNIMEMAGELLAAQFLCHNPAFANEKYDDGTDLETMYRAWNMRMHAWLDAQVRAGFFTEWGSPDYEEDIANAIFNVRDFAEDPVLRRKAEMFLNLYYAARAEETIASSRGGAKMRAKNEYLYQPFLDRGYDLIFNAPGRKFEPISENVRSSSNYYPPPAVVSLAQDVTQRGSYATLKRVTGVVETPKVEKKFCLISADRSLPFYSYITPRYVVGSNFYDTEHTYYSAVSPWQGVIFDGAPSARIGFYIKPASTDGWHVWHGYVSAQDHNVLVVQKWHPSPPNLPAHQPSYLQVYFSVTLDSVVEDESGWIFVQSGESYAAVKVVAGSYSWNEKWTHGDKPEKGRCTITLEEDSPVIVVVNEAGDYNNDFEAFKKAVKTQPISYKDGTLKFATITFFGTKELPQINGETVNLSPARLFDSPFIRSDWNSGVITIRKGRETLKLDFSDKNNPVQTESTSEGEAANLPPGKGSTVPIIFQPKA